MLKKLVLAVALLAAVLAVVGFLLPGDWSVERSVVIAADRAAVYERVATPRAWAAWTAWNREYDPTLQWVYEGPETGLGASMTWDGERTGPGKLDITVADPASGIEYDFRLGLGAPINRGAIRVADADGGVRVVWTSEGDVGGNLAARYLAAFGAFEAMVGGDYEDGLARLKQQLEAEPQ